MGVYRREGTSEYVVDLSPIRYEGKIVGGISIVKEIARLQRELRDTKDALEVLKKAIGILGN